MKTRRGKTLRQFQVESANGSFKGVIITQQVQRRGENDNNNQVERSIDSLLDGSIFLLEKRSIKYIALVVNHIHFSMSSILVCGL